MTPAGLMMAHRRCAVHPLLRGPRRWHHQAAYPERVWLLIAIVVVAVILIFIVGRERGGRAGTEVVAVEERGLLTGEVSSAIIEWPSVFEVVVITRRELGGVWYGFEVMTETEGLVSVPGEGSLGEAFLAHSHQLPGFDHATVVGVLNRSRGRAVCFRR